MREFTYRRARSGSLVAGLGGAILVETVALHLWLAGRHPVLAWLLTLGSVSALVWLAADYRAMGTGALRVGGGRVELRVGRRFAIELPADAVAAAVARPTWRELPAAGTPAARDYLNLTKPATPNVLHMLAEPTSLRLPGGVGRTVRRLGLCVDDPTGFVAAVGSPTTV
jgi:hypothetical protein